MKVLGIIAEYNPFHNGHLYHIEQAKKLSGADYTVAVMSGDYVQRGSPAIYDKYIRTHMALQAGVDLVIELPSFFSTSSAADFASASVSLLDQLGIIDTLCFGSEQGNLLPLSLAAQFLTDESFTYQTQLKKYLKEGHTFPQARAAAISQLFDDPNRLEIMSHPNNILGIEYIMALTKSKSTIKPITIKRMGYGYHDQQTDHDFISASAIRRIINQQTEIENLEQKVPPITWNFIQSAKPLYLNDFSKLLNYRLLECRRKEIDLTSYMDVSDELADRIKKIILDFNTFEERIRQLKTKQYTYTRINRALLHILLEVTKLQTDQAKCTGYVPYARILGFQKNAALLLKAMKQHSSIPLISKTANARKLLSNSAYELLMQTIYHSHIYQSVYWDKYQILPKNEYTSGCIRQ